MEVRVVVVHVQINHHHVQHIQVHEQVITVVGHVMHDVIRMEVHVHHVLQDIQVHLGQQHKVVVIYHVRRDII